MSQESFCHLLRLEAIAIRLEAISIRNKEKRKDKCWLSGAKPKEGLPEQPEQHSLPLVGRCLQSAQTTRVVDHVDRLKTQTHTNGKQVTKTKLT